MTLQKPCNRMCGAVIEMSNKEGRWLPYNLDGTPHKCNSVTSKKIEDKDDHGNESYSLNTTQFNPKLATASDTDLFEALAKDDPSFIVDSNHDKKYVDHTIARPSKVKIFHAENSDLVELAYNEFLQSKTFQWTRAQLGAKGNEFAIALYYEETA